MMGLLDTILGRARTRAGGSGGMSPLTMALLGLLAYRALQGKGGLRDIFGPSAGSQAADRPSGPTGGIGDLLGGGAAGTILSGGLGDLLNQLKQSGQGDKANSWVAKGPNKPVSPQELEQALGKDKIGWLVQETGMSRDDLLAGLSRELPDVVDQLTPEGRLPTEQEAARMV
jgi:uncharacterized protein YidB (DUF937 family)